MAKILLLSFDDALRERQRTALVADGHEVLEGTPTWPACFETAKQEHPDAVVIDLGERASHGRETAAGYRMSKPTQDLPLVLLRAPEAMRERLEVSVPHAHYAEEESLLAAVQAALPPPPADGRQHETTHVDEEDPSLRRLGARVGEAIGGGVAEELPVGNPLRDALPVAAALGSWIAGQMPPELRATVEGAAERIARVAREAITQVAKQATEALQRAGEELKEVSTEIRQGPRTPRKAVRKVEQQGEREAAPGRTRTRHAAPGATSTKASPATRKGADSARAAAAATNADSAARKGAGSTRAAAASPESSPAARKSAGSARAAAAATKASPAARKGAGSARAAAAATKARHVARKSAGSARAAAAATKASPAARKSAGSARAAAAAAKASPAARKSAPTGSTRMAEAPARAAPAPRKRTASAGDETPHRSSPARKHAPADARHASRQRPTSRRRKD